MTVLIVVLGIAVALINLIIATLLTKGAVDPALYADFMQQQPVYAAVFAIPPILLGVVAALSNRSAATTPGITPPVESAAPVPAPPPTTDAALRLLALLQQEARFVDFIQEDIDTYSDEQVGAAVRSIHAGCRKAITDRITLERVMPQEDGSAVSVDKGFDPSRVRLTGNVSGEPPFRGTLEHGGWRAVEVNLPQSTSDSDASIIAPAEVEVA